MPQSAQLPETEVYWEASFAYNDIRVCRPTDLAGCFQSERYFQHCAAEVRSYFFPRAELLASLDAEYRELLSRPTCSVHVRRGDYALYPEFVDLAATDYYERAIARFAAETTFVQLGQLLPDAKHTHLVAVPSCEEGLRWAIGEAHRRYSRRINFREKWRGDLWQGRFASFVMDEPYLLAAARYVELNPVSAGLVRSAGDWPGAAPVRTWPGATMASSRWPPRWRWCPS